MKITLWMMLTGVLLSTTTFAAKRALVYNGPGACDDGCIQGATDMAIRSGLDPKMVGPNALNANSTEEDRRKLFEDAVIWIQPGGKSRTVFDVMTPQLVDAVRAFVREGGGYVGFCAGMFSSTKIVGTSKYPGYGLVSGKTELYKHKVSNMLEVKWNGKSRWVYWEGGPYLHGHKEVSELTGTEAGVENTAYYANGQVASARTLYGKGRVYVTGLHPEAPQWWRDAMKVSDPDGLDYDLADEMIQWSIHANP